MGVLCSIEAEMAAARPIGQKVISIVPTKSGVHLISKPFDLQEFTKKYPHIDIHKDNPTNLYIP